MHLSVLWGQSLLLDTGTLRVFGNAPFVPLDMRWMERGGLCEHSQADGTHCGLCIMLLRGARGTAFMPRQFWMSGKVVGLWGHWAWCALVGGKELSVSLTYRGVQELLQKLIACGSSPAGSCILSIRLAKLLGDGDVRAGVAGPFARINFAVR